MSRLSPYDIVYIQKRLLPMSWLLVAAMLGKRIVYDFDDAIWTCPNMDWKLVTRVRTRIRLREMLVRASCVVAGNNYLAEFARKHSRKVEVIPTCIDTNHYRPTQHSRRDDVTLGWIGSRPNLIYLAEMEPVFRRLSEMGNVSLIVVCDQEYRSPNLPTEFIPWSAETELDALRSMDIGLMPLADNEWTRGKCGFKTTQYMACGIPSVSSPVGFNSELIRDGCNGLLASDADEWADKISLLISNPEQQHVLGQEGRRTVEENYSLKVGGDKLIRTLRSIQAA